MFSKWGCVLIDDVVGGYDGCTYSATRCSYVVRQAPVLPPDVTSPASTKPMLARCSGCPHKGSVSVIKNFLGHIVRGDQTQVPKARRSPPPNAFHHHSNSPRLHRPPPIRSMSWPHSFPDFGPILDEVCSKPPNLQRCRHRHQEGHTPSCGWFVQPPRRTKTRNCGRSM
jgi:hypothetical protein